MEESKEKGICVSGPLSLFDSAINFRLQCDFHVRPILVERRSG